MFQKRQCYSSMELPTGAATGKKNEAGALLTTTENLPRNVIHSRLDGRNQGILLSRYFV